LFFTKYEQQIYRKFKETKYCRTKRVVTRGNALSMMSKSRDDASQGKEKLEMA
jgi:hypothetical protein